MKNVREYFKECFEAEKPKFIRVMRAVPVDQAEYRPHARSTSAGGLVWLLAAELRDACELTERGEVHYAARPALGVEESIAAYEKNAADFEARVARLDDAAWDSKARFIVDGKVVWETSLGDMLFGILFDAIHHRGQLSTYLRPMGAKVPSIYGPSADDPGM
jgi:uncharacterized damage-inducible protein DinB